MIHTSPTVHNARGSCSRDGLLWLLSHLRCTLLVTILLLRELILVRRRLWLILLLIEEVLIELALQLHQTELVMLQVTCRDMLLLLLNLLYLLLARLLLQHLGRCLLRWRY